MATSNRIRALNRLPFDFQDGLKVGGVDVTALNQTFTPAGAGLVGFTPVGNLSAGNVQAALAELESEKVGFARLDDTDGSSLVGYDGGTVQDVLDAVTGPTGAASVGYQPAGTGAVDTTVHQVLSENVSIFRFMTLAEISDVKAKTALLDVTTAIEKALASGAKRIHAPEGKYRFTREQTIPTYVTLYGDGYGVSPGTGATIFLKDGNFNGIVVSGASQLENLSVEGAPGNGLDGIHVLGGRSSVANVSAFSHGREGIKVGDYSNAGANTNIWGLTNIISKSNGRHGLYIGEEGSGASPDVNAGTLIRYDGSGNAGSGLVIGESIDCQFVGVVCQSNGLKGVHLNNRAKGHAFLSVYTEANGEEEVLLDVGADRNFIWGYRSGPSSDEVVNNGTNNIIMGRVGSITTLPAHTTPEAFTDIRLISSADSGMWKLIKEPTTRDMVLELIGTTAVADLKIVSTAGGPGVSGLRFGDETHDSALRGLKARVGVTLNFGAIPAGSSADVVVSITDATAGFTYHANPQFAIPSGIVWGVYWDSTASAVKVRCTNITTGAITVNGAFNVVASRIAA